MIITELKKPIKIKDNIMDLRGRKIKVKDAMIIHFSTGTVWTIPILIQGYRGCDLIETIDNIYNQDSSILKLWTMEEIELTVSEYEDLDTILNSEYLPINGGEYYIDMISHIEFID